MSGDDATFRHRTPADFWIMRAMLDLVKTAKSGGRAARRSTERSIGVCDEKALLWRLSQYVLADAGLDPVRCRRSVTLLPTVTRRVFVTCL
jgi:hypothetical protein